MAGYDGSLKFDTEIDEKGFNSGISKLGSLAKGGFSVLGGAVAGVTAALGGASAAAIKVGSDFEAQMSRVQAISGATGEEFQALRDQAMQLGADTAFSASEAAEGMENLAAAGFNTKEIISAMPGLLDLAAASGEDLATASDIAASTIRGFGLAASDAAHVADVLAENANRTNSSVTETGEAMKYISPVARAAGLSMEETAAAIGIMANAGIQGSQAGTTLRGALSRLAKPTDDMLATMQQLGLSFYDSEGRMKSLADQVSMLKSAMQGMTDEQKNNALVTLYGQESLSGMLALINEGPESLSALTQSFMECDGAAQKAAATMQDNLQGAIEQMKGSAETLGIVIFDSMSEPLKGLAQQGTEIINQLTDSFKSGGLQGMIEAGGTIIANLAVGIAQNIPGLIGTGVQVIQSILDSLTANMPQLISSGGQILQSIISGMIQLLPSIGTFITTFLSELYTQISQNAPALLEQGYQLLRNLMEGFVQAIPEALPRILEFIQGFGEQLAQAAPIIIQKGFELLSMLVQGIVTALPILIAQVPQIITTFANIINDNFPTILAKGVELLGQLILGILQAIPDLIAAIPQIIEAIVAVITAYNWLALGKNIIELFKNGITSMVSAVRSAGTDVLNAIKGALQNLPSTLSNLGRNAIHDLGQTISGLASYAKTAAMKVASAIETAILRLPGRMSSIGSNIVSGLWNGISGMYGWVVGKINSFVGNIVDHIKGALGIHSPSKVFRDEIGKYMALGMGVGFEKNIPTDDMVKSIGGAVNRMQKKVSGITTQPTSTAGYASAYTKVSGNVDQGIDYLSKKIDNLAKRPIEVTTKVFDRAIARSTAVPMQEEIQKNEKLQNMIRGERS